jgi:hypothetical protein
MVMHPGMQRLQAYSAGELSGAPRRRTATHVARCHRCRSTMEWMDDIRGVAREEVTLPAADGWAKIAARVDAKEAVLLPVEPVGAPHSGHTASRALRVALLTLMLGGAAAAAIPGTWLRDRIEGLLDPWQAEPEPGDAPAGNGAPAAPVAPVTLFIEPSGGAVVIALERPHAAVRIHVQLVDTRELEMRAQDGAAGATFRSSPGRLDIIDAGSGSVMIALPRSIANVRIIVDGRTYLIKDRGQVRVLAPTADTIGTEYILPVTPLQ